MANKLRAFISSTMEDLGNERRAVAKTLEKMGIVPMQAEKLSTSGNTSWDVIYPALAESHIFVLILGDRYGWVPDSGYGAGQGLSVTHLELKAARELRKPILVFMKRLAYGAQEDSQRDKLRQEVSDWSTGVFREEFEWADDLAEKVWRAITSLWQDSVLRTLVQSTPEKNVQAMPAQATVPMHSSASGSQGILLAGAGMSIAAGYPTASFLMRLMASDLWGAQVQASELQSLNFSALAGFYAAKLGGNALRQCVAKALDTPQIVNPTQAHFIAVRRFQTIITTNYDGLFERACMMQGLPFRVINPQQQNLQAPAPYVVNIYKLVGSVSDKKSMVITDIELENVAASDMYKYVLNLVASRKLFVIGHGLRDGNVVELLKGRSSELGGTYVSPLASNIDEVLYHRYGLKLVRQTADDFMSELDATEME